MSINEDDLSDKVDTLEKMNKELIEEWATIDTAVRKCAMQAGFSEIEVYGDSYGVPATEDIIELIATKIKNLNTL